MNNEAAVRDVPSAGPWITQKEIDYVTDAVTNGWYANWSGYLDRFEKTLAEYTNNKFAIVTSSCTGALHLAMLALGLKEGDEVLVPESTWVATATSVCYTGATPVFVDVEPDTWCMDPEKIKSAISRKTKAIIPVHMYGHPANMPEINAIAAEHGIVVIEDAAPGIGSKIGGQPTGSFGLGAAFSFQGAKPLATGEGGALVTSDENFYDRAYYYWDHCRDQGGKVLYNTDIGVKYKMSNIQAALGLAQLERADEIITKRRQIFFWYRDRLKDLSGISLNVEREGYFNSYYVPTIILKKGAFRKTTEEVMNFLNENGVRNRPFFRCLSKLPMFKPQNAPVADNLAENGINLPCASMLTEDDIDYSVSILKTALGR